MVGGYLNVNGIGESVTYAGTSVHESTAVPSSS
jgi:hypothetical protein